MSGTQTPIFVHIQRTGGTAIRRALGLELSPPDKHRTAVELRDAYGAETFAGRFKFAFVRNPWERLVSWWSLIDALRPRYEAGAEFNRFQSMVLARANSFDEFLENCAEPLKDEDGEKWIYRNQIDYIADEGGRVLVDFVGRHEALQQGFDAVAARLGRASSPVVRINGSRHEHYTSYYSPGQAAMVAERYARDLAAFGYEFGP